MKNKYGVLLVSILFLTGCATSVQVTPESYGARAGEDGAKYYKEKYPGTMPSSEAAGLYCANIVEVGAKQYGWTMSEILQSGDICASSFGTEIFKK